MSSDSETSHPGVHGVQHHAATSGVFGRASSHADGNKDMPSSVDGRPGLFDQFAQGASRFASRPLFFTGCVLLVVLWVPSFFLLGSLDTWQLIINTATTIVTFLMVALLQNSQTRADLATQHKLNAIAQGLAALMNHAAADSPQLRRDIGELREAVGLEERESA
ncbi:low affinity iron permease family protein [Spirillospora sp. NPDC050679]